MPLKSQVPGSVRKRPLGLKSEFCLGAGNKLCKRAIRNVGSISESLWRRTELKEKKNSLIVYSREHFDALKDLGEGSEFLKLLEKITWERLEEDEQRGAPTPLIDTDKAERNNTSGPSWWPQFSDPFEDIDVNFDIEEEHDINFVRACLHCPLSVRAVMASQRCP